MYTEIKFISPYRDSIQFVASSLHRFLGVCFSSTFIIPCMQGTREGGEGRGGGGRGRDVAKKRQAGERRKGIAGRDGCGKERGRRKNEKERQGKRMKDKERRKTEAREEDKKKKILTFGKLQLVGI